MMGETLTGAIMLRTFVASSLLAASAALAAEPARTMSREAVPAALAPAVAKGDVAADMLRDRFLKRVTAMLAQGGPKAALTVCPTEAPRIAKEVGELYKVDIGRTSFRLRNPANAPRPWAASHVARRYPQDRGIGFAPGDLRGFIWVEVRKR
jgi:hypothetical protein